MRGKITQADVAKACKLDQGSVSRILNKDTRDHFSRKTVEHVFKVAKELGYLHPAIVTADRRESPRKKGVIRANIVIVIGNGSTFDEGTADIDVVSLSGMLLRNIRTKKAVLPLEHCSIIIDIVSNILNGFKCRCHLARFADNESNFALALKYDELTEDGCEMLKQYLKQR